MAKEKNFEVAARGIEEQLRRRTRNISDKDAMKNYLTAAQYRVSQANSEISPRIIKDALTNAINDYENAIRLTSSYEVKDKIRGKISNVERMLYATKNTPRISSFAILAIISLVGALFFVSFNITGNAIGELSYDNVSLIGTGLFILGLVFAFVFFKGKEKKKK